MRNEKDSSGDDLDALRAAGIRYAQGFLLARPAFEALPAFTLPGKGRATRAA